jgi:hypothetical protein
MSKFAGTIGKVAGVIATVAMFIPGGQVIAGIAKASEIAAIAAAVSTVAMSVSEATKKAPPVRGQVNKRVIGANSPIPYIIGRTYSAGMERHDVGYGGTVAKVENPYRFIPVVHSLGPIFGFESMQADFAPVPFSGSAATGYYAGYLYRDKLLGATPESRALVPQWSGAPGWSAAHKLSGLASVGYSFKFDKGGKVYASGLPAIGEIALGRFVYDPRQDSTFPGGLGTCRKNDPATWVYSESPALHAGVYAMGITQNGAKVFGCNFGEVGVDWADVAAWANVCDANGWKVGGIIYEPAETWNNLKLICQAGGCEPILTNATTVKFRWNAPRVALDVIRADDILDGELSAQPMKPWAVRRNTIFPKYRSEAHAWDYVQSAAPVSVPAYVTEDGEEKSGEQQYDLVQNVTQAVQLAYYEIYDAREAGPFLLTVKPRLRQYRPGDALTLLAECKLWPVDLLVVLRRRVMNAATGTTQWEVEAETSSKHAVALAATGEAPPAPTIPSAEYLDQATWSLASDLNTLTIAQKIALIKDEETRDADYAAVRGRLVTMGLSFASLDISRAAWIAWRQALLPYWSDVSVNTPLPDVAGSVVTNATYGPASPYGYTGDQANGAGLRDGGFLANASIWGSNIAYNILEADLGGDTALASISVASISTAHPGGWAPSDLSGAVIEYKTAAAGAYTALTNIAGVVNGVALSIPAAITARYVRIRKANFLGVGEFAITTAPISGRTKMRELSLAFDAAIAQGWSAVSAEDARHAVTDANGNLLGTSINVANSTAAVVSEAAPASPYENLRWVKQSTGQEFIWTSGAWALTSDITTKSQIAASMVEQTKTIAADYQGALIGALPVTFVPIILRNGLSIKTTDSLTYAVTKISDGTAGGDGGTVTVDNGVGSVTKGTVSVTAFTGAALQVKFRLTINYNGLLLDKFDCTLTKDLAPPPTGNGAGTSTKLKTVVANQSNATISDVTTTSNEVPQLVVASGEKLYASGVVSVICGGTTAASRNGVFTNQYSTNGTSWNAFGAAISGGTAYSGTTVAGYTDGEGQWVEGYVEDPIAGSADIAQNVTVSATTYYLRTIFKCNITGRTLTLQGETITYEAKP